MGSLEKHKLIHPAEEKVKAILESLKEKNGAGDLRIKDCHYFASHLEYLVTFSAEDFESKGHFFSEVVR